MRLQYRLTGHEIDNKDAGEVEGDLPDDHEDRGPVRLDPDCVDPDVVEPNHVVTRCGREVDVNRGQVLRTHGSVREREERESAVDRRRDVYAALVAQFVVVKSVGEGDWSPSPACRRRRPRRTASTRAPRPAPARWSDSCSSSPPPFPDIRAMPPRARRSMSRGETEMRIRCSSQMGLFRYRYS